MENETIWIVMPAYNVEKFIGQALESLLGQTWQNWRCLILNDGSQDKTGEVMKMYAAKDRRFICATQKNQGVTKASNTLLNQVQGPYMMFMDADDYLHPQMLESLMYHLKKTQADVAECGVKRFVAEVEQADLSYIDVPTLSTELLKDMDIFLSPKTAKGGWINKWNKIYRWDKVKDIRYDEALAYEDDYFYNSVVHRVIDKKVVIYYPFYFYRKNPNSLCGKVNWNKYQSCGMRRVMLSYQYFIQERHCPVSHQNEFMRTLAQDGYRMIVRKPLKKSEGKAYDELFCRAQAAVRTYVEQGILVPKYLSLYAHLGLMLLLLGQRKILKCLLKLT